MSDLAEARRHVTGELMAELLMLLSYTEAVEANLALMDAAARSKVGQLVVATRKERDYAILDDIASQASRVSQRWQGRPPGQGGGSRLAPAETSANMIGARVA